MNYSGLTGANARGSDLDRESVEFTLFLLDAPSSLLYMAIRETDTPLVLSAMLESKDEVVMKRPFRVN